MKKQFKMNYESYLNKFILAVSLLFFIAAITGFFRGFHNLDLGQNIDRINTQTGLNYGDIGSDGVIRSATSLYIIGANQIFWSEFYFVVAWFSLLSITIKKIDL